MDLRKRGNERGAVVILNEFIARYSGSLMLEDAYVERFRALKHAGEDDAAIRSAGQYLGDLSGGLCQRRSEDPRAERGSSALSSSAIESALFAVAFSACS